MSESAPIIARLKQVRGRIFIGLFINASSIAVCCLAVLFALQSLWPIPWLSPANSTAALLFSLALIFGAAAAFLRMPTREQTAKLVDRRAGLQQRLETAWECLDPSSEIEILLVRDAREKLLHIRPVAVAPVRLTRPTRMVLNIGMICICVLALVRLLGGWNRPALVGPGNRIELAADAGQGGLRGKETSRRTAAGAKGGAQTQDQSSSRAASPSDSVNAPEIAREANQRPQPEFIGIASESIRTAATDKIAPGDEAVLSPATVKPEPAGFSQAPPAAANEKTIRGLSGDSHAAATTNVTLAANSGPSIASSGAASIRAMAGGTNAPSAGTPGKQAKGGQAIAAGDATGLTGSRELSRDDADFLTRHAGDYQSYWFAAERALAKEKIPPGFKKYVADYFAAIHR